MNLDDDREREHWARQFQITQTELKRIVRHVGPDANTVARFLAEQTRSRANAADMTVPPRKVVAKAAIAGLIRAQMALFPECAGCGCGPIRWRAPDFDGCNWSVTRLDGANSLYCLERLAPLISNLRESVNVPDPDNPLRTVRTREAARRSVRAVPTAADVRSRAVFDHVEKSRAAVRQSRALLSLVAVGRKRLTQCLVESEAAMSRSREMLDSLDAARVSATQR
jgi:hypothetical protein